MSSKTLLLAILAIALLQASAISQVESDIHHLKLTASAEPLPILKYRFYRPLHELTNDSPDVYLDKITELHRSLSETDLAMIDQYRKNTSKDLEQPSEGFLNNESFQAFLEPIHQLAMCSFVERQATFAVEPQDYWSMELPHLTVARDAAYILKSRIESSKSLDDRVNFIADGIRLAEYVGQGATFVHKLTGYAIYGLMLDSIESTIVAHQDVNLYWAMTSIPRPLLRLSNSMSMEFHVIINAIEELREENVMMAGQDNQHWIGQYNKVTEKILSLAGEEPPPHIRTLFTVHVTQVESVKRQLVSRGIERDELEKMPATQVIMLGLHNSLVNVCQELEKLAYLDIDQLAFMSAEEERILNSFRDECNETFSPAGIMFSLLQPNVSATLARVGQLESRLRILMTIEAIRLHAFNENQLPESIDALTYAAAQKHLLTGNHFEYKADAFQDSKQSFDLVDSLNIAGYTGRSYRVEIHFPKAQ